MYQIGMNEQTYIFRDEEEEYYQETLYAALVIASRLAKDEKTSDDICNIGILAVEWALKLQDPDHALDVCKALSKMCERMMPDRKGTRAKLLYLFGHCYFLLVCARYHTKYLLMISCILFTFRKNLKMPKMSLIKPTSYVKTIVRFSRPKSVLA